MNVFARVVCVAIVCTTATVLSAANPAERFAERVPANACLASFSADVAATCAAFQKTGLGEALCGAEFAPFIAELAKRDLTTILHMRPAFGFDWKELAATHDPGGVVMLPLADGTLGAAWLFTPEQNG